MTTFTAAASLTGAQAKELIGAVSTTSKGHLGAGGNAVARHGVRVATAAATPRFLLTPPQSRPQSDAVRNLSASSAFYLSGIHQLWSRQHGK